VQQAVRCSIDELPEFQKYISFREFLPLLGYEVLDRKKAQTSPAVE
jgi:hypothetical protein